MSRRNNRERLGGAAQSENSPAVSSGGFDFSFVAPSVFVELPSGGKFYNEGHPLHNQNTIEIREMTAREEDILADVNLQKSGVAIDKLIKNLIVDKSINPNSLLVGDKNAIVIEARVAGYGSQYKTKLTCPSCASLVDFNFNLNELSHKEAEIIEEEIEHLGGRIFQATLPRSEYKIRIKLMNAGDMSKFNEPLKRAMKGKSDARLQTTLLKLMIHSIENKTDGVWFEDRSVINQFVETMPSIDSMYLRTAYKLLAPDVEMTQEFDCPECGHNQEMEVPLDAGFFWPDR